MAGIEPASEMFSHLYLRRVVYLLLEEHLKILTIRQTERQNPEPVSLEEGLDKPTS